MTDTLAVELTVCVSSGSVHTVLAGGPMFTWYMHSSDLLDGRVHNKICTGSLVVSFQHLSVVAIFGISAIVIKML